MKAAEKKVCGALYSIWLNAQGWNVCSTPGLQLSILTLWQFYSVQHVKAFVRNTAASIILKQNQCTPEQKCPLYNIQR